MPPPDNESMPSHGWFFACCMRQHHKPLPDSLQLEQTLSDSLSLSFQGLFPPPTLPSIPASQPQAQSSSLWCICGARQRQIQTPGAGVCRGEKASTQGSPRHVPEYCFQVKNKHCYPWREEVGAGRSLGTHAKVSVSISRPQSGMS